MSHKRYRVGTVLKLLGPALAVSVLAGAPAQAVVGSVPSAGANLGFVAKVDTGERACTGALINAWWVVTAASCFAVDGQALAPGAPAKPATVTIGRTDLTTTGGHVVAVTTLVPRPDRDLVLAKLARAVRDIAPVPLSTSPAAPDQALTAAGYGRTATEWVPDSLHTAQFTVESAGTTTFAITGLTPDAALCKGDAGGPALREAGGRLELVGLHHTSWQGGCYAETETRRGAVETRVDDLLGWITQNAPVPSSGDFNGDGRADVAGIDGNGDMRLYVGDGAGLLSGGALMWTVQPGGWASFKAIAGGDFNGDGRADVAGIDRNGDLRLYVGDGAGLLSGGALMWTVQPGGWASFKAITGGDFNGDGRADVAGIDGNGDLRLYVGDGAGLLSGGALMWTVPRGGWASFKAITGGDFNGDGRADVAGIDRNGDLRLYVGDGAGLLSGGALMWTVPRGGWASFKAITGGDFNGDGRADVAGIDGNGDLRLYTGDGAGLLSGGALMWTVPRGGWARFKAIV
ncbi:FG-GAP-like repeat-containing protein [Micromonospora zamorensis]|uniref:FG-GAP-like repeat-containing protein n=1 Tax=Micromonospora zamorensis TaxID=709883 RepID=UPI002E239FDD